MSVMVDFCLRRRGDADDGIEFNGMESSMALTALGRLSVPLLDELAVGTAFRLLTLRLRQVRGLVQGEDAFGLDLGRAGKPLSREASADV